MFSEKQLTAITSDTSRRAKTGAEGRVHFSDTHGVKLQHVLHSPYGELLVNLAERRRRAVHGLFSELASGTPLLCEETRGTLIRVIFPAKFSFLKLQQASHANDYAVGTFPYVPGKAIRTPTRNLYDAARVLGAVIDCFGANNVIYQQYSGEARYTILETYGGIHPESLTQLQALKRLESPHYQRGLYFLGWILHLEGLNQYPTCPQNHLNDFEHGSYSYAHTMRINTNSFWKRLCWSASSRRVLSLDEQDELIRARRIFGAQFSPQVFDTEMFSNHVNFGLQADFIDDIVRQRKKLQAAAERVKAHADRAMKCSSN